MLDEIAGMLQGEQLLFLTLIGVVGLCVGSFINVVIYRLPIMLERQWSSRALETEGRETAAARDGFNLFFPRSHCPHCKKHIAVLSNIPIFSYLFLGGRSPCCLRRISIRYPLTEALTMGLSVFVASQYGVSWECVAALGFSWALLALFFIDVDHKMLPDAITLPLIWAGLLCSTFQLFTTPESALFGAALGYLIFWSVAFLFKRFRNVDGLGQGDFKLLAACGAWLGWQLIPFIILFSSLLGAIAGSLYILVLRRNARVQIPFGPFIAIAAFAAMIWGEEIMLAYINFSRSLY